MYLWQFDEQLADVGDWIKKYDGTIMLVNDKLTYVNCESSVTKITFVEGKQKVLLENNVDYGEEYKFKPWFPESTWLYLDNLSGKATPGFLRRVPARQWKKSANPSCYKLCYSYTGQVGGVDTGVLANIQKYQRYYNLNDVVEQLRETKETVGCPLNKYFVLIKQSKNLFCIYSPVSLVAFVDPRTMTIKCNRHVKEILSTLVGETWKVTESVLL